MRILISGATGLIGSELVQSLRLHGHEVACLVRNNPGANDIVWDSTQRLEPAIASGFEAAIHLAGEPISKRWTNEQKRKIRDSRVIGTRNLLLGLTNANEPPPTLLSASAVGIYGDRGDEFLDETSEAGSGFLPTVAKEWEEATKLASDAGIRVVNLRTGLVLSKGGGALAQISRFFRLGLGGQMGSGNQYWSWIAIEDWIAAALLLLEDQTFSGPVNMVSPNPVRNREFVKTLAKVLRRPAILHVPSFMLRLVLGEMANELILASARVVPKKLLEGGFQFRLPNLEDTFRAIL